MFYLIQGGGIRIDGSADLTDCNIHDNVAGDLSCLLAVLCRDVDCFSQTGCVPTLWYNDFRHVSLLLKLNP